MVIERSKQGFLDQPDNTELSNGRASNLAARINELPAGERYLYQLFSLIETTDLMVTNPEGNVFQFGKAASAVSLHLIIHNSDTYNHLVAFGVLGFCETYMDGWWDEESDNLVGRCTMKV